MLPVFFIDVHFAEESGPTKAAFDVDVSTCFNRVLQIYGGAMGFEHLHRGTEGGLSQTFFGSGPF